MTSSNCDWFTLTKPLTPTPVGTRRNRRSTSSLIFGLTSERRRFVRTSRIPQLMSKPIPPGEMTPFSGSKAATPPIGKPYPQCASAMAYEYFDDPREHRDVRDLLDHPGVHRLEELLGGVDAGGDVHSGLV